MTRLQSELQRLYLPSEGDTTRAMVLGVAAPGSWDALSAVWRGVQADLQLPAPGIAVAGEGCALWFSLAQPVPVLQAMGFLAALRARYLGEMPDARIRMQPQPGPIPPYEIAPGRWSAFVAHDLAPLFAEEPWLDLAPGDDAQAELLSRLQSIAPADLAQATPEPNAPTAAPAAAATNPPAAQHTDPRAFLLAVMNDPAVALPLRIEAAKALLPYSEGPRRP